MKQQIEIQRAHNFNAGPSALPLAVLEKVQQELVDFRGTGMSIMELVTAAAITKMCTIRLLHA